MRRALLLSYLHYVNKNAINELKLKMSCNFGGDKRCREDLKFYFFGGVKLRCLFIFVKIVMDYFKQAYIIACKL